MTPPALDDDLRLTQRVEDLTVEEVFGISGLIPKST